MSAPRWSVFDHAVGFETGIPFEWLETLRSTTLQRTEALLDADLSKINLDKAFVAGIKETISQVDNVVDKRWMTKVRRQLKTGYDLAQPPPLIPAHLRGAYQACIRVRAEISAAQTELEDAYRADVDAASKQLLGLMDHDALADSILTTSPHVHEELQRRRTAGLSKGRLTPQLTRRLSFYLARGALKTHVACRLGTVVFPRFSREAHARVDVAPPEGDGIKKRRVFVSYWATLHLARTIFATCELFAAVRPKIAPSIEIHAAAITFHLDGRTVAIDPATRTLLDLIDGKRNIAEITTLCAREDTTLAVRMLGEQGVVQFDYVPPVTIFDPIVFLRSYVAGLVEGDARNHWLTVIDRLVDLCAAYEHAALTERASLAAALEQAFEAATGCEARRNHGGTYGDRRIFYEECLSDFAPSFNAAFLSRLEEEVGLALEPCLIYGRIMRRNYRALSLAALTSLVGEVEVPFCRFVLRLQQLAHAGKIDLANPAIKRFELEWSNLVHDRAAESADGIAYLSADDLAALRAFSPPEEDSGAHATVDLFIAAASANAIAEDDFSFVIGEVGENIMPWGSQFYFAEDRDQIEREVAAHVNAIAGYRPLAMILPTRTHKGFLNQSFAKAGVLIGADAPSNDSAAEVPIRDLRVARRESELVVFGPDGTPLQLFHHHDELVHLWSFAAPRIVIPPVEPRRGRTPRIMVGRACLQRAQFYFRAADLAVPGESPVNALRRLTQLRRDTGVPERVFVHIASEPKPLFLDFRSAVSVLTAQYVAAKDDRIRLTEMLPTPDQLWARRDDGHRAIELRVLMTRTGGR